ncbi:agmatine deiminase family protein [Methylopila sp. M107]|uniref:agmatine deiminase family protein n=1 Tax=Methylopila sp. M107 TaxID=1101190 RepID=UPI00036DD5CD|nr:agmatine deiminase family protein [Methylopila sp. M107]
MKTRCYIVRRGLLKMAAALGGAALLGPRAASAASDDSRDDADPRARAPAADPRLAEYEMPVESAPHERTFMQWPVLQRVYDRRDLRRVKATIARIANAIAEFEPVVLLASGDDAMDARAATRKAVEIWDIPTDDLWCRDSGPTFVRNAAGDLAVAHIRFNGWGGKQQHRNDGRIAETIAKRLGLPLLETGLVGEQGGVEHDGAGTLLAHASCWVNPNRSRESAAEIGDRLKAALGGTKMIWTPGLKGQDITDYHIDALARFVAPGRLLIQLPEKIDRSDPFSVAALRTYELLKTERDAKGRPLELIVIPEPVDIRSRQEDFVASYVNHYVCNGAVIAAQFGDARADDAAKSLLGSLYPGRKIVTLDVDPLGEAGGGIHCATQQQPKAGSI